MATREEKLRTLGFTIAQQRERKGLTQSALAIMVSRSSHSYISRIENGKDAVNVDLLFDICEALDISMESLFRGM